MPIIKEYILPKSVIFSDEYPSYDDLGRHRNEYDHRRINHSAGVYVMGDVHTNTIDGFWSLVKRGIGGVYHQVSKNICSPTWTNTRLDTIGEIRAT